MEPERRIMQRRGECAEGGMTMFHHHKSTQLSPVESPRDETVRLLQSPEELRAAIERARAFERSGVDEHQRRVGAHSPE